MKIERVKEEDVVKLLEIYAPYVEKTAISFEYEVPSVEEFRKRIRCISEKYPYIKAVDDKGEILGYAYAGAFKVRSAYNRSVETTIYIKENCRRNGIGRSLYESLEKLLKEMGIINLYACIAYTAEEDDYLKNDSLYFHQKLGYNIFGTFHQCGYKFNRWYDMIWMEKMIGNHGDKPAEVKLGEWTLEPDDKNSFDSSCLCES
ncbi:MAG: GNAT family N-acetyltransferase [Acutalibacteraceae bacterium]